MKKFSLRLLMLAALVSIACSAYTPKTIHHLAAPAVTAATAPAATKAGAAKASQMFYWFLEPMDWLDVYADISYETGVMEMLTGGFVDTDPTGGVCLALGYAFPYLPHTMAAQVGLYLH